MPKARQEVWDLVQLILTVPLPRVGRGERPRLGEADALLLEDAGWALWQRRGDPHGRSRTSPCNRRVRAQVDYRTRAGAGVLRAAYASALLREMSMPAEPLFTRWLTKGTLDVVEQQTSFPWFTGPCQQTPGCSWGALPQD